MYGSLKADALNRTTKEIRKALPHVRKYWESAHRDIKEDLIINSLITDAEVNPEIRNLVRIIIEESESELTGK